MSPIDGQSILITGGSGSFGRQFIVEALKHNPRRIICFSRDEHKQAEMRQVFTDNRLRWFIGDVRDAERLHRAFDGVDIVVHAAALKRIETAEYNPMETIATNVTGSCHVVDAALDCGVKRALLVSTDKVSYSTTLYGSCKHLAEGLFVQGNSYSDGATKLSVIRLGNYAGSRGSVIPLFLRQRDSGVLTVTDERMTRFWLPQDGAAELAVYALEHMQGGEVFVPKLPSFRIVHLAQAIAPEARIEFVGLRGTEKLAETLLTAEESQHSIWLDDTHMAVLPANPMWGRGRLEGRAVEIGSYASDTNDWWLGVEELGAAIQGLRGTGEKVG